MHLTLLIWQEVVPINRSKSPGSGEFCYNSYGTDFLLPTTFVGCCLTEPLRLPCKTAPSRSRPTSGRTFRVFILSSTVLPPSSWEKSERWLSKSSSELLIAAATSASSGNRLQCHPRWRCGTVITKVGYGKSAETRSCSTCDT